MSSSIYLLRYLSLDQTSYIDTTFNYKIKSLSFPMVIFFLIISGFAWAFFAGFSFCFLFFCSTNTLSGCFLLEDCFFFSSCSVITETHSVLVGSCLAGPLGRKSFLLFCLFRIFCCYFGLQGSQPILLVCKGECFTFFFWGGGGGVEFVHLF